MGEDLEQIAGLCHGSGNVGNCYLCNGAAGRGQAQDSPVRRAPGAAGISVTTANSQNNPAQTAMPATGFHHLPEEMIR